MTGLADPAVDPTTLEVIGLHRLMTGYLSSSALFSAVELGLFDALSVRDATAEEVGAEIGIAERPARVLLLALEGEGLVLRTGDRYANSPVADTFLVSTHPRYLGALAGQQARHLNKIGQLTQALRDDRPVNAGGSYTGEFQPDSASWARRWAEVMRASSQLMADDLATAATLSGRRHLVDLGCASGSYAMAFAAENPQLKVTAVEQPAIAAVTAEFVAAAGMDQRVTVRPGNIFEDTFPDCDVALLSHVIQGFARKRARQLLEHVYSWLPSGGELLIHSHLPEQAKASFPYQFGLILLVNNTQGGEAHTERLTTQWLREIGFTDIGVSRVSPISALVRAAK
jgi:cyclopropane fatty-acyl-phospholipid synthase-like methyltransferase